MRALLSVLSSHFETLKAHRFTCAITFIFSISLAQPSQNGTQVHRPVSIEIAESQHAHRWLNYLSQFKNYYPEVLNSELSWLATEFRYWNQRGAKASPFFEFLNSNRHDLPIEVRWLLSAIEIQRGTLQPATLNDALQALERIDFTEDFSLFDVFKTQRLSREIYYTHPDDKSQSQKAIRLLSLDVLADYFNVWHKSPLLAGKPLATRTLESKRLKWFQAAINLTRDFDISGIRDLVSLYADPNMRTFTSSSDQYEFYKSSLLLFEKIQMMYARYSYDHTQGLQYGVADKNRIPYLALGEHIKNWLSSDISFMLDHFFKLQTLGVFSLEEFFNKSSSEEEKQRLVRVLEGESEVDSKLAAGLYLIKHSGTEETHSRKDLVDRVISILHSAKNKPTGIEIQFGKSSAVVKSEIYYQLLSLFYNLLEQTPVRDAGLWKRVLSSEVVKFSSLSEEAWARMENQRLDCLSANIDNSSLEEYLFQLISGKRNSSLSMRVLAGAYFRKKIKSVSLVDFTTKVLSASGHNWEKNSAELVYIVHSLNPQNPALLDYLNNVYLRKFLTSSLSPQEALRLLGLSGQTGIPHLKSELLKKLSVVGVGDTAGTFSAFIRLFPNDVLDMASVIHRHRSAPEKLKPLLQILILSSAESPSLLEQFLNQLSQHPDKAIATATYQGLTLDKWLQYQVNRSSSAKCEAALSSSKPNPQGVK